MQLSIIIVNYNVRYFLEQCLLSVRKARQDLSLEIFVVDNNSSDDSLTMLREKFPKVILIENRQNVGFSAANNQAIRLATGQYILLLNPDTILSEDCLVHCFSFMQEHPDAGAVCVKMIDGSGRYLPESKRGKPTLTASFFKMTGIYHLFPKSAFFNAYYAGHIDEDSTTEIEVMTGAFMFLRKEAVEKVGLLDETFFMYGEDIDYSYRILEAGYRNYYLPTSTIIHFKGESTKKSSLNYTRIFYNAMIIFVRKHYKGKGGIYITFLQLGVIFKAVSSYFLAWVVRAVPLLADFILVYFSLVFIKKWWGQIYFDNESHINHLFDTVNAPVYAALWVLTALLMGHYKRKSSWMALIRSILAGTALILMIYALFDSSLRNSRLLILLGGLTTFVILMLTKWLKNLVTDRRFGFLTARRIKYAIVAGKEECSRIEALISKNSQNNHFAGRISLAENSEDGSLGNMQHLNEIVDAYELNEVIFSQRDVSASYMMQSMARMNREVDFRVAPDDTLSIISSNDKNKQGELLTVGLSFKISSKEGRINKRALDMVVSALLLILSPVLVWLQRDKGNYFSNIFSTLTAKTSWVGYAQPEDLHLLPQIRKGILPCTENIHSAVMTDVIEQENLYYARNYHWIKDLEIIIKNINKLDAKLT